MAENIKRGPGRPRKETSETFLVIKIPGGATTSTSLYDAIEKARKPGTGQKKKGPGRPRKKI